MTDQTTPAATKPKKRKKYSYYKIVSREVTLANAISEACGEMTSLGEECRENADTFESLDKGNSQEKADAWSEAADPLEQIEEPSLSKEIEVIGERVLTYGQTVTRRRNSPMSRSARLGEAVALLDASIDFLNELLESVTENPPLTEEQRSELDQLLTDCEEIKDACEGIDFPGMFG